MSIFSFVKSKLSILDIALEYVQLKRAGGYWKGSCPFHQETDASFTVSPDKQIFYCFGCHTGGDLIEFIAKIENMTPIEAVKHLVDKYNINVPPEVKGDFTKSKNSGQKNQFFATCGAVALWAHEQLNSGQLGFSKRAKEYLEKRGISADDQKRFLIGYFPGGVRFLNRFLKDMTKKNVLAKDLITAGIVSQGRSTIYSAFEERILFPIKDSLGRFCGFGGRVFNINDERAKYYNSKESEWFNKGKLLFGLYLAKKDMQQKGKAFLVEGYTDCVAMVKHGYKNCIATLGTACTNDHLKTLSRFIKTLYVVYDGDSAGQKAILRLTKLCWEANLDLQIISLPDKDDPASFLEKGGDIAKLVDRSCDIFTFFVSSLGEQFWGKSLSEKMELCDKMVGVIAKINDKFKQDLLLQKAASVTQVPFGSLKDLLKKRKSERDSASKLSVKAIGKEDSGGASSIEEKIASIVINSVISKKRLTVDSDLLKYFSPPVRSLLKKVEIFLKEHEGSGPGEFDDFINCFEEEGERDWVIKNSFAVDQESPDILLEKLIFRFRKQNWKRIVQDIKQRIVEAKQENNVDELKILLDSFLLLKREMKQRGLI